MSSDTLALQSYDIIALRLHEKTTEYMLSDINRNGTRFPQVGFSVERDA